jgi:Flp pilus assembly protein TadG
MRANFATTRKARQRGNALLEAALAAPMLFLMLSGVIDFGRAFYFTDIAAGAARAGAQYGIISSANFGNYAGMEAAATADSQGVANFTVTATSFCQNSGGGTVDCATNPNAQGYVKVVTHINYPLVMPLPGLANPLRIGGIAVLRAQ